MPFTFAHPAAVLPLKYWGKDRFSSTGLIIGSMIPDFEGFFRLGGQKSYSHSLEGVFGFDLPLGILMVFIFHLLVRNPLIDNLPRILRCRFSATRHFDWNRHFKKQAGMVFISLTIGILTHLAWDSVTHTYGYLPVVPLGLELSSPELNDLQKWLQYGSSIAGILFIGFAIWKLPVQVLEPKKSILPYWLLVLATMTAVILVRLIFHRRENDMFNITTSGFLLGLLVASILLRKQSPLPYSNKPLIKD